MFNWFFKDKFLVEKALLAGHHRTYSQRPSVLHFSFNKAATQTVKKLLIECARRLENVNKHKLFMIGNQHRSAQVVKAI